MRAIRGLTVISCLFTFTEFVYIFCLLLSGEELLSSFYRIESSMPTEKSNVKKYMTFIKTYQNVYDKEKSKILSRQDKLSKGVSKLVEAKNVVTKLKGEIFLLSFC